MKRLTNSRLADAVKSGLFIPYDEFEEIKETMRTTREPSFNEIYCKLAEYEDKEEKQNKLLDVLVKVGVKDYVKEIIYDYELDEDEQKLLEDFIKEE